MYHASVPSIRPSRMSVRLSALSGLLVCLSGICVSAFTPHATFRYEPQFSRRGTDAGCNMCFADECWILQKERCWYYAEVQEAIDKVEAGGVYGKVDTLMHDMVTQAAASWMNQKCIPFISQYTDCNKENICIGCKSCSCDAFGKWSCNIVQRCRAEPYLDVDHRMLVSVVEVLKNDKATRKKRSIEKKAENTTAVPRRIDYAEVAEWMYGVKPNMSHLPSESTTNKMEVDYIEFDEVLKNIAIDNIKYKRRKPQLYRTNNYFNKYVDEDEIIAVRINDTDQFMKTLNAIIDGNENSLGNPNAEESSNVVVDLLTAFKNDNLNASDFTDSSSNKLKEKKYLDDTDYGIILDANNIMKRDVTSLVMKLNATTASLKNTPNNTTAIVGITELKNNVLSPLNKIIDDKEQELKDLMKIKEHLVQFITKHNFTTLNLNKTSQEALNNTKATLSIYNVDVFPEIQINLRNLNPNLQDKLLYKLKRDIYEVIRDVIGIKKLLKANNLPEDLKSLIRAMSIYVYRQRNATKLHNDTEIYVDKNIRRQFPDNNDNAYNSTKDYIIKILEVLDKNTIFADALSSLSHAARKIVKRVIKNYYFDDFSIIGLMVYDPEYNMTNDLRKIGNKWQIMTENVAASSPTDKIYAMKLLHLTLSVDIHKMNDALALIDFAHSRRMIPIEGSIGEGLLDQINRGLKSIDDKIQTILEHRKGFVDRENRIKQKMKSSKIKYFMKELRNLLKGSKKDIVELVNKNVPRSEIVKTIAKKRLDELAQKKLSDYKESMRKWQTILNVIPRNKRSLESKPQKKRLKNIIPKYLRGKLSPALVAKKLRKTHHNTQKGGK